MFYTDCCEPVSGNLYAVTEPGGARQLLAPGDQVALGRGGRGLATVNRYALAMIDLDAGRATTRSFTDVESQLAGEVDVVWSANGRSLIVLDAAVDQMRLLRFDATESLAQVGSAVAPFAPRSSSSSVRFAGRGPNGEIVVAIRDTNATVLRWFDPLTLVEVDPMIRRIDGPVSSVQLGPDGRGVLWVSDGVVTYRSADGRLRSTGTGFAAAWFTAR